ncbi:hypothetical protein MT391_20290 [Vibrio sp. 1-Bac 57]
MQKNKPNLPAKKIVEYIRYSINEGENAFLNKLPPSINDDIEWVVSRWPSGDESTHKLSQSHYNLLIQAINRVPTGKRKDRRIAFNAIILYLEGVAKWQLPEQTKQLLIDRDKLWFTTLNNKKALAYQLVQAYQSEKNAFLASRHTPLPVFVALMLAIEVAPLSLNYLASILADKDALELKGCETTLKVKHLPKSNKKAKEDENAFTRYHLPLYCYRLLETYYQSNIEPLTPFKLCKALNAHIAASPYYLTSTTKAQWHAIFQSIWATIYRTQPLHLKDMAFPDTHVDFDKSSIVKKDKDNAMRGIYLQDWQEKDQLAPKTSSNRVDYQHKKLITQHKNNMPIELVITPKLRIKDVIEYYLFFYCKELIINGGINGKKLEITTIRKYTMTAANCIDTPLSYETAISDEQLQMWAMLTYKKVHGEQNKWYLLNFFKFLSTQALTDNIDISAFDKPYLPPSIDSFRITIAEHEEIVDGLLSQGNSTPLQRLFAAVTAILAYFTMSRRMEILNLTNKGIYYDKDYPNRFTVFFVITKGRKPRTVNIVITESMAKLVRMVMDYKKESPISAPLIGFNNEKINSRNQNYLLPVTKAIKAVCGQKARFHHLRKSGIHLLAHQLIHFVYCCPSHDLGPYSDLSPLLSPGFLEERFSYLIEQNKQRYINDNGIFDEICRQVGHQYFTTTRWYYFHGTQWLFPYLRAKQCVSALRTFTHAELRFLLRLSPTSNDLSRQLMRISSAYKNKSTSEKQNTPVMLTEGDIRAFIFKKTSSNAVILNTDRKTAEANYYAHSWRNSWASEPNQFIEKLMIAMQKTDSLDFNVISNIWNYSGKHQYRPLTKKQKTALAHLGEITVFENEKANQNETGRDPVIKIKLPCNVNNARHFALVFRQQEWNWLGVSFELRVNRKNPMDRLLTILKTHYQRTPKEKITHVKLQQGDSHLIITLTPKFSVPMVVIEQAVLILNSYKEI